MTRNEATARDQTQEAFRLWRALPAYNGRAAVPPGSTPSATMSASEIKRRPPPGGRSTPRIDRYTGNLAAPTPANPTAGTAMMHTILRQLPEKYQSAPLYYLTKSTKNAVAGGHGHRENQSLPPASARRQCRPPTRPATPPITLASHHA